MQKAEALLASFQPARLTLDAHLDEALAALPVDSQDDDASLRQLVYGATRYSALLDTFKAAFYHHCSGSVLRQDATLYALLTYLAIMRLEDLGIEQFAAVLKDCQAHKVAVWASFLLDAAHLRGELREEWCKVYDKSWVDARIGVPPCGLVISTMETCGLCSNCSCAS